MGERFGLNAAPPSTNIFVAGLPMGIDDHRLREVFSAYGEVVWTKVLREGRDGRIPGIVEFSNIEHATWVVANVHGGIPQGLTEPVDVKFKDERSHFGGGGGGGGGWGKDGGKGGYGKGGWDGGKGGPYGPPDSTSFDDQFFAQTFAANAAAAVNGATRPPRVVEPVPSDNVYVKGLPLATDEILLKAVFGAFGTVTQCRVCPGGETKRTALVRFQGVEEAALAIQSCSGQIPAGLTEPIEVRFADTWDTKQKRNSDGTEFSIEVIVKGFESSGLMPGGVGRYDNNNSCALYIAGLPNDTTDFHLYKMFSPLGPIAPRGVRALLNEDGSCKGIAFVNYQREDSVQAAIAVYHGALLPDGNKLKVQQKTAKPAAVVLPAPGMGGGGETGRVVPPPPGGINALPDNHGWRPEAASAAAVVVPPAPAMPSTEGWPLEAIAAAAAAAAVAAPTPDEVKIEEAFARMAPDAQRAAIAAKAERSRSRSPRRGAGPGGPPVPGDSPRGDAAAGDDVKEEAEAS